LRLRRSFWPYEAADAIILESQQSGLPRLVFVWRYHTTE